MSNSIMKKWISAMLTVLLLVNNFVAPIAAIADGGNDLAYEQSGTVLNSSVNGDEKTANGNGEGDNNGNNPSDANGSTDDTSSPAPSPENSDKNQNESGSDGNYDENQTESGSEEPEATQAPGDGSDESGAIPMPSEDDGNDQDADDPTGTQEPDPDSTETELPSLPVMPVPTADAQENEGDAPEAPAAFTHGYAYTANRVSVYKDHDLKNDAALLAAEIGTLPEQAIVYVAERFGDGESDDEWMRIAFAVKSDDEVTVMQGFVTAGDLCGVTDKDEADRLEYVLSNEKEKAEFGGHPLTPVDFIPKKSVANVPAVEETPDAGDDETGETIPGEPEYFCGLEEHAHGEACYDEEGNLICELEEHTHDESCLLDLYANAAIKLEQKPAFFVNDGKEGSVFAGDEVELKATVIEASGDNRLTIEFFVKIDGAEAGSIHTETGVTDQTTKQSYTPEKAGTYEFYAVASDSEGTELESDHISVTVKSRTPVLVSDWENNTSYVKDNSFFLNDVRFTITAEYFNQGNQDIEANFRVGYFTSNATTGCSERFCDDGFDHSEIRIGELGPLGEAFHWRTDNWHEDVTYKDEVTTALEYARTQGELALRYQTVDLAEVVANGEYPNQAGGDYGYTIDVTRATLGLTEGDARLKTVYVNLDQVIGEDKTPVVTQIHVRRDDDQTVIFNTKQLSLNMPEFKDTYNGNAVRGYGSNKIIVNAPKATVVVLNGGEFNGTLIAPKATMSDNPLFTGWIAVKRLESIGNEFHSWGHNHGPKAPETSFTPEITKTIALGDGTQQSDVPDVELEFTITGVKEGDADWSYEETVTANLSDLVNGKVPFETISRLQEGTYTFTVKETGTEPANWVFDSGEIEITVVITPDNNGGLTVSATYVKGSTNDQSFTNTYTKPDGPTVKGSLDIGVTKSVSTSETLTAYPDFEFELRDASDNVVASGKIENWNGTTNDKTTITIPEDYLKTLTPGETYSFTLVEKAVNDSVNSGSWTAQTRTYSVTITVGTEPDGNTGNLPVTVTINGNATTDPGVTFVNTYTAFSAKMQPEIKKVVTPKNDGVTYAGDDQFSFELESYEPDGIATRKAFEGTKKKNGAGTIAFDEIVFQQAGTYYFAVREVAGNNASFEYDPQVYYFAAVVMEDGSVTVYKLLKNDEGTNWADFADGDYWQEVTGNPAFDVATFTNTYAPKTTAKVGVTKTVNLLPAGANTSAEFTFTLKNANDEPVATKTLKWPEDFDGQLSKVFEFDTELTGLEYGQSYEYWLSETITPSANWDTVAAKKVIVSVAADGTVTVTLEGGDAVAITNTYNAPDKTPVDFEIDVDKTIVGTTFDNAAANPTFTFDVSVENVNKGGSAGVILNSDSSLTVTASSGAQATGKFSVTFTEAGTYRFTIKEQQNASFWSPSEGETLTNGEYVKTVTVVVEEDGDGNLVIKSIDGTVTDATNTSVAFSNTYTLTGASLELPIEKKIIGDYPADGADQTFRFDIVTKDSENNTVESATKTVEITLNGAKTIDKVLETLSFDKAGKYTITVSEQKGNAAGFAYSTVVYTVEVTFEEANGALTRTDIKYSLKKDAAGDDQPWNSATATFENEYSVTEATFDPGVTKRFENDIVPADAAFTFELKDANAQNDGYTMPSDATVTITGAGSAQFKSVTFTKAGTYKFQIVERKGDVAGVTYDETVWTVTVNVIDVGGKLEVAEPVVYEGGDMTDDASAIFVNAYVEPTPTPTAEPTPSPTPVEIEYISLGGTKTWVDDGNAAGIRPDAIEIVLYANGVRTGYTPKWTKNGDVWSYTFENLPRTTEDGTRIVYTVTETPVDYYETTQSGMDFTNTIVPREDVGTTDINGTKTWMDDDNANGNRPDSITIELLRNGEVIDRVVVSAANGWSYSFTNLPNGDGYGTTYTYTIREQMVSGYYPVYDGYDVTNVEIPTIKIRRLPGGPKPDFSTYTEEELEDLLLLFDYGVPLFGMLLGTGDELPMYPFVFGGIGVLAVAAVFVFGRKKKEQ